MHYYKRNIGDYAKKAGRLTMLQHGAFTLLLDACYDRERFPTKEEALEWTWACTEEETQSVLFVLSRFFEKIDGVFIQSRVAEELAIYQEKAETNKRNGMKGGRPKKTQSVSNKTQSVSTETQTKATETHDKANRTLTNNHKPITKNQEPNIYKGKSSRFVPPTQTEVSAYMIERGVNNQSEAEKFFDFYSSKGWMVGKNKMKDWKAAVRNWLKSYSTPGQQQGRYLSKQERREQMKRERDKQMGFDDDQGDYIEGEVIGR